MRAPRSALVVDAAILIASVRGRNSGALLKAARERPLIVTERGIEEARRRIELGLRRPELTPILMALVAEMTVVPAFALDGLKATAESVLEDAVASRNGSTADAHVLACAWAADGDIWSFDRDFAGTGVASWSTANLMRAFAEA